MSVKLIYLCGPITGKPGGNRIMFEKAESFYTNRGNIVINPHNYADLLGDVPEHKIVRDELAAITCHVDKIALLPGWESSRFGMVEIAVGIASGIEFIEAFTFKKIHPTLKISANGSKTSKDLACQYGPPKENAFKTGGV